MSTPPTPGPGRTADGASRSGDRTTADRYGEVRGRIADAARRAGRPPESVLLVAVTKFADPDQMRDLIALGHRDFGENKLQQLVQRAAIVDEYLSRHRVLAGASRSAQTGPDANLHELMGRMPTSPTVGPRLPPALPGAAPSESVIRWHMIGHLQRNKAKKAVELCRLIHSVDSLRLAEEIQDVASRREQPVDVLVQVNCSGEATKSGCAIPAAGHLCEQIDTMMFVRVRGLMTMAAPSDNPEDARRTFARCRELFDEIKARGVGREAGPPHFNILSMGMSGDYEVAIREGANLVRVGSAIFGPPAGDEAGRAEEERETPDEE